MAGLEALLGLRRLMGPSVEIELVAPDPELVLRPLLVAEPFGLGTAMRLDLEEIANEQGARFRRDAVAAVDPAEQSVRTRGEETLRYDALLLAIGARPVESVPGAINSAEEISLVLPPPWPQRREEWAQALSEAAPEPATPEEAHL